MSKTNVIAIPANFGGCEGCKSRQRMMSELSETVDRQAKEIDALRIQLKAAHPIFGNPSGGCKILPFAVKAGASR